MDEWLWTWGPASGMFWVRAVWALVFFVAVLWLARVGGRGTRRALEHAGAHANAVVLLGHIAQLGIQTLGTVLALAVLGVELSALAAFIGFAAVALSLSFQDILRALLAGLYLLVERPFQVGDTIDVGGQQGVIEDVGMRTTILRAADGNRVIVPNLVLFTSIVARRNGPLQKTESN